MQRKFYQDPEQDNDDFEISDYNSEEEQGRYSEEERD